MAAQPTLTTNQTCCGNCSAFEPFPRQDRTDTEIGSCHRNPPQIILRVDKKDNVWESPTFGQFPVVLNNFWCEEFHPAGGEKRS